MIKLFPSLFIHDEALSDRCILLGVLVTEESHLCDINPFRLGKAGTATSAMSEKVRTRLEELDDFEEVSESFAESQEQ